MKVLIVDDSRVTLYHLVKSLERWGYETVTAPDGETALSIIHSEDCPRLAIVDWVLPGIDGLEVCKEIRKRKESYIYTILLTGKSEIEDVIEGLESGADDYLVKPFHPQELKLRLETGQRIINLEAELLMIQDRLRKAATHDGLTGLMNRTAIIHFFENELSRGKRENKPVGIIMADIDHFKKINDTHGHLAGDTVLVECARRMRASLRTYDACGRYGGEEFLFVLPNCEIASAHELAERIRLVVADKPFYPESGSLNATISGGFTSIEDHSQNLSIDDIIQNVDDALYEAKRCGRNLMSAASLTSPEI